jgi:hypothetical protein
MEITWVVVVDGGAVQIWNVATHRFLCSLSGHLNWVRSAVFSSDARLVASASEVLIATLIVNVGDTSVCIHLPASNRTVVGCLGMLLSTTVCEQLGYCAVCSYYRVYMCWDCTMMFSCCDCV